MRVFFCRRNFRKGTARIFGQNGEKNYEMCGILKFLSLLCKYFWSLSIFCGCTFFGERRDRRVGGGMYFTGAGESIRLRVQDGRVAARCGVAWCGVAWRGAVRCSAAWCGAVWCGAAWSGTVWCGVLRRGAVWRGAVWCGAAYAGNTPYASRVGAVCYVNFQAAEQHR